MHNMVIHERFGYDLIVGNVSGAMFSTTWRDAVHGWRPSTTLFTFSDCDPPEEFAVNACPLTVSAAREWVTEVADVGHLSVVVARELTAHALVELYNTRGY